MRRRGSSHAPTGRPVAPPRRRATRAATPGRRARSTAGRRRERRARPPRWPAAPRPPPPPDRRQVGPRNARSRPGSPAVRALRRRRGTQRRRRPRIGPAGCGRRPSAVASRRHRGDGPHRRRARSRRTRPPRRPPCAGALCPSLGCGDMSSAALGVLVGAAVALAASPYLARLTRTVPDRDDRRWWTGAPVSTNRLAATATGALALGALAGGAARWTPLLPAFAALAVLTAPLV